MKLEWLQSVLLWAGRASGGLWILISLLGLAFSGGKVDMFGVLFLLSLLILTFAPQRTFRGSSEKYYLLVVAAIGTAGPLRLFVEQAPEFLMAYVPVTQLVPLVLFTAVLALGHFREAHVGP